MPLPKPSRKPKQAPAITVQAITPTLSLVREDGVILGFIEKYPDTATEQHPFKAFKAVTGQGPVHVDYRSMQAFWSQPAAIGHLKQFKGVC